MIEIPLGTKRFTEYKGTAADNRRLVEKLAARAVKETFWTGHAIQRGQEMVVAGFEQERIKKALWDPQSVTWSERHGHVNVTYEDVSVGVMSDRWGRAIVVTILPNGKAAWEQFYKGCPESVGRQRGQRSRC